MNKRIFIKLVLIIMLLMNFGLINCGTEVPIDNPIEEEPKEEEPKEEEPKEEEPKEEEPKEEEPKEEEPKEEEPKEEEPKEEEPKEETYDNIYTTKLISLDIENNRIQLKGCQITKLSSSVKVYQKKGNDNIEIGLESLLIGEKNIKTYIKNNEIIKIEVPENIEFTELRVAIRKSINDIASEDTLYHDSISFVLTESTTIESFDGVENYNLPSGNVEVSIKDGMINIVNGYFEIDSMKRLIIKGTSEEIKISSISRSGTLKYSGDMDISIYNGRLLLINEVNMEDYLRKVVPSEVYSSWPLETLKAQAVAARTYAYREIYNQKYMKEGYVVDDSTSSQVYNNGKATESTDQAVKETEGIVMFNGDEPIIAYYFSTSSGLTANGNEVWIEDGVIESIPYLIGKNLSKDSDGNQIEIDYTSESSMLEYFKLTNFSNPSETSSYYRWKIAFSKDNLKKAINANIQNMYQTYPESFLQLIENEWVSKEFPSDIGNIENIFVSERGESGVVVSLTIVTDKITFKVYNQYNIRFLIRPRDAGGTVTLYYGAKSNPYGRTSKNPSILNSGFFALEWSDDSVTFYGGGNGHGVGMDQYGAEYYGKLGYTYEEILTTYYSNIEFKTIKND